MMKRFLLTTAFLAVASHVCAQGVPRPVNAPTGLTLTSNNMLCTSGNPQQATDCGYQPGVSVISPGTPTLEAARPIVSTTGPTKAFSTPDLFKETRRSNAATPMADTFPASGTTGLVNGTVLIVANVDASAIDTITAGSGTTISGNATDIVEPGRTVQYVYDGAGTWRRTLNTAMAAVFATPSGNVVGNAVSMRSTYGGVQDSGKPLPTGAIVGTTDVQALTGKSIDASEITTGALAAARGGAGTITGALKANGSGAVSQAACADLSNAAASCSTDTTSATNVTTGTLGFGRLPTILSGDVVANSGASTVVPADTTLTALIDRALGGVQGDVLIRNASVWTVLAPGATGQALCTNNSGANPAWCSNRQALLMSSSATQAQNTTLYYPCSGNPAGGNATEANVAAPLPFAGTFRNLYLSLTVAPTGAQTIAATLRVNGASPGSGPFISVTSTNTAGNDTSHTASITVGQTCDIQVVSSGTAAAAAVSTGIELDNP